jgi:hypothetical protein
VWITLQEMCFMAGIKFEWFKYIAGVVGWENILQYKITYFLILPEEPISSFPF